MKHFDHKATAEDVDQATAAEKLAHLAHCDMLDAGVVAWDAKGRCDFVNDRAVSLLELKD